MIKDGLYSAHFATPLGHGSGVVVVAGNQFRGGDAGMAYVGTLSEQEGKLFAQLHTFRHTQVPGQGSVFGKDDVHVALTGTQETENRFRLSEASSGFQVVLNWFHD